MILDNLPSTSAYWQARHDSEGWALSDYLWANMIDLLAAANWQRGGDSKAPKPKRLARPGERKTRETAIERNARAFRERAKAAAPTTSELIQRRITRE